MRYWKEASKYNTSAEIEIGEQDSARDVYKKEILDTRITVSDIARAPGETSDPATERPQN